MRCPARRGRRDLHPAKADACTLPLYAGAAYTSQMFSGLDPELDRIRRLVKQLKAGDSTVASLFADHLAAHPGLRGFSGLVVPAPRSTTDHPSLLFFAEALVRAGVGRGTADLVHRVRAVPSSREARSKGGQVPDAATHRASLHVVSRWSSVPLLLVDDVVTTGMNLCVAAELLREAGWRVVGGAAGAWTGSPARGLDPATAWSFRTF